AHEIKNPLHAMVINLEVLKRRVAAGNTESALERAVVLEQELRRVNELVNQLLLLLRPPREGVQLLDLDQAMDQLVPVVEALVRVAHRTFHYRPLGTVLRVPLRPDALAFALTALVSEAIAASPADAAITLDTAYEDGRARIRIRPARSAGEHANATVGVAESIGPGDMLAVADAIMRETGGRAILEPARAGGEPAYCVTLARAGRA
ncbi:MAG: histidine kinase dimerization/phospho-acceptor domain-containing protein, partial [Longimicrobiales bacterium]